MPTYRITILGQNRRPLAQTTCAAFSDQEALERARSLSHGREVEIEQLGRHVATITRDAGSDTDDH